jgi:hypothetical protein
MDFGEKSLILLETYNHKDLEIICHEGLKTVGHRTWR